MQNNAECDSLKDLIVVSKIIPSTKVDKESHAEEFDIEQLQKDNQLESKYEGLVKRHFYNFQAEERGRQALIHELATLKQKQSKKSEVLLARKNALELEKARAKNISSRPPPLPQSIRNMLKNIENRHRENLEDNTEFTESCYLDSLNQNSDSDKENNSDVQIDEEQQKLTEERNLRAQRRFNEALRKDREKQDQADILKQIENAEKYNRRQLAKSIVDNKSTVPCYPTDAFLHSEKQATMEEAAENIFERSAKSKEHAIEDIEGYEDKWDAKYSNLDSQFNAKLVDCVPSFVKDNYNYLLEEELPGWDFRSRIRFSSLDDDLLNMGFVESPPFGENSHRHSRELGAMIDHLSQMRAENEEVIEKTFKPLLEAEVSPKAVSVDKAVEANILTVPTQNKEVSAQLFDQISEAQHGLLDDTVYLEAATENQRRSDRPPKRRILPPLISSETSLNGGNGSWASSSYYSLPPGHGLPNLCNICDSPNCKVPLSEDVAAHRDCVPMARYRTGYEAMTRSNQPFVLQTIADQYDEDETPVWQTYVSPKKKGQVMISTQVLRPTATAIRRTLLQPHTDQATYEHASALPSRGVQEHPIKSTGQDLSDLRPNATNVQRALLQPHIQPLSSRIEQEPPAVNTGQDKSARDRTLFSNQVKMLAEKYLKDVPKTIAEPTITGLFNRNKPTERNQPSTHSGQQRYISTIQSPRRPIVGSFNRNPSSAAASENSGSNFAYPLDEDENVEAEADKRDSSVPLFKGSSFHQTRVKSFAAPSSDDVPCGTTSRKSFGALKQDKATISVDESDSDIANYLYDIINSNVSNMFSPQKQPDDGTNDAFPKTAYQPDLSTIQELDSVFTSYSPIEATHRPVSETQVKRFLSSVNGADEDSIDVSSVSLIDTPPSEACELAHRIRFSAKSPSKRSSGTESAISTASSNTEIAQTPSSLTLTEGSMSCDSDDRTVTRPKELLHALSSLPISNLASQKLDFTTPTSIPHVQPSTPATSSSVSPFSIARTSFSTPISLLDVQPPATSAIVSSISTDSSSKQTYYSSTPKSLFDSMSTEANSRLNPEALFITTPQSVLQARSPVELSSSSGSKNISTPNPPDMAISTPKSLVKSTDSSEGASVRTPYSSSFKDNQVGATALLPKYFEDVSSIRQNGNVKQYDTSTPIQAHKQTLYNVPERATESNFEFQPLTERSHLTGFFSSDMKSAMNNPPDRPIIDGTESNMEFQPLTERSHLTGFTTSSQDSMSTPANPFKTQQDSKQQDLAESGSGFQPMTERSDMTLTSSSEEQSSIERMRYSSTDDSNRYSLASPAVSIIKSMSQENSKQQVGQTSQNASFSMQEADFPNVNVRRSSSYNAGFIVPQFTTEEYAMLNRNSNLSQNKPNIGKSATKHSVRDSVTVTVSGGHSSNLLVETQIEEYAMLNRNGNLSQNKANIGKSGIKHSERISVAVSGGHSPNLIVEALRRETLSGHALEVGGTPSNSGSAENLADMFSRDRIAQQSTPIKPNPADQTEITHLISEEPSLTQIDFDFTLLPPATEIIKPRNVENQDSRRKTPERLSAPVTSHFDSPSMRSFLRHELDCMEKMQEKGDKLESTKKPVLQKSKSCDAMSKSPYTEYKVRTQRLWNNLEEVKKRKDEISKKEEMAKNRLKMKEYSKKIKKKE